MRNRTHKEGTVYRVGPGPASTWRVSTDSGSTIASFNEKSAAVSFALTLARGDGVWPSVTGARAGSDRRVATRPV